MRGNTAFATVAALGLMLGAASPALAGSHAWTVNELFSNADGTIQFIELYNPTNLNTEFGLAGKYVRSVQTGLQYDFTVNLPPNTAFRSILLATADFAALPGAPVPDHIIPDNFIDTGGDTIQYWFYDQATFPNPPIPLDGIQSLHVSPTTGAITVGTNTPKNYAGVEATIDASPPPAPPQNLAYSEPSPTYFQGIAIAANTPSWSGGTPDDFSIDPPLPLGLAIDPVTGWITGTPGEALTATDFLVTASNAEGSTSANVMITVEAVTPSPTFQRGDANQDGAVSIADPIQLLGYLFQSLPSSCTVALDSNDDGAADLGDAIHLLGYLFSSGPTPPAPFGTCGLDPSAGGSLTCVLHAACP